MIKQTIHFMVPPDVVYKALMDETVHSTFTGAAAKIDNKVGGKFSVWDGYASGRNLELIPNKKIVQEWRALDWAEGISSKVTFEFIPEKNPSTEHRTSGTKLRFVHENVPRKFEKEITEGWRDYYWLPMKEYFTGR